MRRLLFLLAITAATIPVWAGRIQTDSIKSQKLGVTVKYNVYLPDGFDRSQQHYPLTFLLHGLTDIYTAWDERGKMREIADELIESGEAAQMVIVMPNAGGPDVNNTWNGYFNMPQWPYEDFIFQELMPQVEQKYRCGGSKQQRAVMGLSMGGGGSTVYCQRHPDLFSACYAMSPWLNSGPGRTGKNGEKTKMYYTSEAVRQHSALDFIDRADDNVKNQLKTVSWFFDCGDDDMLLNDTFELYKKMRLAGIKAELRVRNGGHTWEYWRQALRTALPFVSRSFSK